PKYLAFGANGFLGKKADVNSIILAIKTALSGEVFLGRQSEEKRTLTNRVAQPPFDKLSKRESQIAQSLVKGQSLTEISKAMNLKETTVSTYKKRILEKTGVKTLSDLIAIWQIYQ